VGVAEPFASQLREAFGFDSDMRHFAILGRCRDCTLRKAEGESGEPSDVGSDVR
jgi:Fur family ferric uptake transcriptional regulator